MKSSVKKTLAWLVLFMGLVVAWPAYMVYQCYHRPLLSADQSPVIFNMPSGVGIDYLTSELVDQRLLKYPQTFFWLAQQNGNANRLKAGEYVITPGMTVMQLLNNMAKGRVLLRRVAFIEGWTFQQVRDSLKNASNLKHTIDAMTNVEVMSALGYANEHPEGRFFPDTYFYSSGDSDVIILQQAYQKMQQILQTEWQQRDVNLPYTDSYQALIVASLIEKETARSDERTQISGVILRRLQKNMRLQIDPTILYGLGQPFDTPITRNALNKDTPYNTYRNYGLPPTPIDMPSQASIYAALHPAAGDALYYVSQGDGSHTFSSNYTDHQHAVAHYVIRELFKKWFGVFYGLKRQ